MKYGTENHPRLNILQEVKKIRRMADKLADVYEAAEKKPMVRKRIMKKAMVLADRLTFLMKRIGSPDTRS